MLSLARKIYKTENKTMRDPLETYFRSWEPDMFITVSTVPESVANKIMKSTSITHNGREQKCQEPRNLWPFSRVNGEMKTASGVFAPK